MQLTDSYDLGIPQALKKLMDGKAKRDQSPFTICQLAKALEMPHSMLVKLAHPDPQKRVINPRIDTLSRIVSFFKADGFDVTIDDLLDGMQHKTDIVAQTLPDTTQRTVELYSFSKDFIKIGHSTLNLSSQSGNIIGLLSDEDIKPFFKAGSLFIIDRAMPLENEVLVAINLPQSPKTQIKRCFMKKKTIVLSDLLDEAENIILSPKMHYVLLGVVIHVNAKVS